MGLLSRFKARDNLGWRSKRAASGQTHTSSDEMAWENNEEAGEATTSELYPSATTSTTTFAPRLRSATDPSNPRASGRPHTSHGQSSAWNRDKESPIYTISRSTLLTDGSDMTARDNDAHNVQLLPSSDSYRSSAGRLSRPPVQNSVQSRVLSSSSSLVAESIRRNEGSPRTIPSAWRSPQTDAAATDMERFGSNRSAQYLEDDGEAEEIVDEAPEQHTDQESDTSRRLYSAVSAHDSAQGEMPSQAEYDSGAAVQRTKRRLRKSTTQSSDRPRTADGIGMKKHDPYSIFGVYNTHSNLAFRRSSDSLASTISFVSERAAHALGKRSTTTEKSTSSGFDLTPEMQNSTSTKVSGAASVASGTGKVLDSTKVKSRARALSSATAQSVKAGVRATLIRPQSRVGGRSAASPTLSTFVVPGVQTGSRSHEQDHTDSAGRSAVRSTSAMEENSGKHLSIIQQQEHLSAPKEWFMSYPTSLGPDMTRPHMSLSPAPRSRQRAKKTPDETPLATRSINSEGGLDASIQQERGARSSLAGEGATQFNSPSSGEGELDSLSQGSHGSSERRASSSTSACHQTPQLASLGTVVSTIVSDPPTPPTDDTSLQRFRSAMSLHSAYESAFDEFDQHAAVEDGAMVKTRRPSDPFALKILTPEAFSSRINLRESSSYRALPSSRRLRTPSETAVPDSTPGRGTGMSSPQSFSTLASSTLVPRFSSDSTTCTEPTLDGSAHRRSSSDTRKV